MSEILLIASVISGIANAVRSALMLGENISSANG